MGFASALHENAFCGQNFIRPQYHLDVTIALTQLVIRVCVEKYINYQFEQFATFRVFIYYYRI
jgi:hypothetical protein